MSVKSLLKSKYELKIQEEPHLDQVVENAIPVLKVTSQVIPEDEKHFNRL